MHFGNKNPQAICKLLKLLEFVFLYVMNLTRKEINVVKDLSYYKFMRFPVD